MKRDNPMDNVELGEKLSCAFKVEKRLRSRISEICLQTGIPASEVVNKCIEYGLNNLTIKPVVAMGLVFGEEEEEAK